MSTTSEKPGQPAQDVDYRHGYEWLDEPTRRNPIDWTNRQSRVNWLRVAIYGGSVALVLGTLGACTATFWH